MPYVITQNCCSDASCVAVCPVNCIHPTPEEAEFATSEMLYVDPDACIECGACVTACPVGAIAADYELTDDSVPFIDLNRRFYDRPGTQDYVHSQTPIPRIAPPGDDLLKVAIIGSGPSAMYAAENLLSSGRHVEVDIFERLPALGGLVRYGVAPDHTKTKEVQLQFERTARRPSCQVHLNVEVGRDLSLDDLAASHHAVIHASGAAHERSLGIPGEALPGSHAVTDFVAWYNGHPDASELDFDLSGERAVIIGNGNVAMDAARILLSDPAELAKTDISDLALKSLSTSRIREVVVVGRRGPAQAALTIPELYGLSVSPHFDLAIEPSPSVLAPVDGAATPLSQFKGEEILRLAGHGLATTDHKLVLRFLSSPVEIVGIEQVTGIRLAATSLVDDGQGSVTAEVSDDVDLLECGLVLRSTGYRGRPISGLPFEEADGTVPNAEGRVIDPISSQAVTGQYVAGWIKRGPSGVIGTNKRCARETVRSLLDDFDCGRLRTPEATLSLPKSAIGLDGWENLDRTERQLGAASGRTRVKLVNRREMLRAATGAPRPELALTSVNTKAQTTELSRVARRRFA